MISTYVNQREMIVNSNPVDKILMDWPFLGKVIFDHSVESPFKANIPAMAAHFFFNNRKWI